MEADLSGFNIDAPQWDQSTFLGRVKHFFNVTDPRTVFVSEQELDWAKAMVEKSRMGLMPRGTKAEQLLYAKKLYDSAFHPDTGEKMNVIGRMSFQVPGGMIITGFMLQFYRELIQGVCVKDGNQNELGHSQRAAAIGITQVVISRITMAAPGMILLPVIMERLEKLHFMRKVKVLHAPLQVMLSGCFLLFMVPVACGLFPQECKLPVHYLEPELQDTIKTKYGENIPYVYFNKGL